jgi:hypothetical protein
MNELDFSTSSKDPIKSSSNDDFSNLNNVGLYIIQKLREEDLKESLPSLDLEELNIEAENLEKEIKSKLSIVDLILNNRDILINLEDFYEEDCQLSLLNWACNINRKFFANKNFEPLSEANTHSDIQFPLNKDLFFKKNYLNNKAEILLFNILNIFEIFPIKPDDLKSLNFIEKLTEIKQDMKSRNLILYKKVKKLVKFWKKMIKFFDSQKALNQISEILPESQSLKHFDLTLNKKRLLENSSTEKKEKDPKPEIKDDNEMISSSVTSTSLDEIESGENKIKKKNVKWKDFLVEKIEFNPMNAPLEI